MVTTEYITFSMWNVIILYVTCVAVVAVTIVKTVK